MVTSNNWNGNGVTPKTLYLININNASTSGLVAAFGVNIVCMPYHAHKL